MAVFIVFYADSCIGPVFCNIGQHPEILANKNQQRGQRILQESSLDQFCHFVSFPRLSLCPKNKEFYAFEYRTQNATSLRFSFVRRRWPPDRRDVSETCRAGFQFFATFRLLSFATESH